MQTDIASSINVKIDTDIHRLTKKITYNTHTTRPHIIHTQTEEN
jgi:hypothetical protein